MRVVHRGRSSLAKVRCAIGGITVPRLDANSLNRVLRDRGESEELERPAWSPGQKKIYSHPTAAPAPSSHAPNSNIRPPGFTICAAAVIPFTLW
jgi:hypothetical protein